MSAVPYFRVVVGGKGAMQAFIRGSLREALYCLAGNYSDDDFKNGVHASVLRHLGPTTYDEVIVVNPEGIG